MSDEPQAEAIDPAELAEFRTWRKHREACLNELKSLAEAVSRKRSYLAELEQKAEKEKSNARD